MTVLKNNYVLIRVLLVLGLLSCNGQKPAQVLNTEGYLKSTAYKEYIESYKERKSKADYSTKRLFTLLGEEAFLCNSDHDFYMIYCYIYKSRDTVDFFVLKSKDSIVSISNKRPNKTTDLFFFDKPNGEYVDSNVFDFEVKMRLVELDALNSANEIAKNIITSLNSEDKDYPPYHSPARGVYLYYKNQYYLINDLNVDITVMNEIDSFFRKSELLGTE